MPRVEALLYIIDPTQAPIGNRWSFDGASNPSFDPAADTIQFVGEGQIVRNMVLIETFTGVYISFDNDPSGATVYLHGVTAANLLEADADASQPFGSIHLKGEGGEEHLREGLAA